MSFILRPATPENDETVADHFYRLWAEYDLETLLAEDWLETTLEFIADARVRLEYAAFIAEAGDESIGSAACQVFSGLYPSVFQSDKRKYGYVWGVYVEPERGVKEWQRRLLRLALGG